MYQKFYIDSHLLLAHFFSSLQKDMHFFSKEIFSGNNLIGKKKGSFFSFFTPTKRVPVILLCEAWHDVMHSAMDSISFYPIYKATAALELHLRALCPTPPLVILLLDLNLSLMVQCFKIRSKLSAGIAFLPKLILNLKVLKVELSLIAFNYLNSC